MDFKNILVTGGCGFIGSNFINSLDPDVNVFCIDKIDYVSREEYIQHKNCKIYIGNICDDKLVSYILNKHNIDVIIHFAAQSHVDNSFKNSLTFTQDNIFGTHTLLECSRLYGKLKRFIHISTDEVYGEVDLNTTCCEKSLLNPTNPYAATKAGAEFLVRSYLMSYNLPIIITRGNNVYGKHQYPEKLISRFIFLLLNNKKCTIQGKGVSLRNFIHVDDVCNAVKTIMYKGEIGHTYNIGSNNEYSVLDIAKLLIDKLKPNEPIEDWIEYIPDRNFNDFRYSIDYTKLKELGWSENKDFMSSIDELIVWLKENINLYKKIDNNIE
jgi:dTDP-glucose 4,6-dehydratase